MKKFLSVLLAVMMVLSTFVMAAPSAVTGFDTAWENTSDDTASLAADITLTSDTNLISTLGGSLTVTASASTTFTVDVGSTGATYSTTSTTVTITAPSTTASGVVKITAADGATKNIYINTDTSRAFSSVVFDLASQGNFTAGDSASVTFSNGTANFEGTTGYFGLTTKDYSIGIPTYPYICFKAKTDTAQTYSIKVYLTPYGTAHSEAQTISTAVALTEEYQMFALDMSTIISSGSFGGMMFTTSTSGNIEFDEISFATYDPTSATYGIALTADKYTVDEVNDADTTITLTPEFFSDKGEVANKDVTYSYDEAKVIVSKNQSTGVATLTPLKSGECVVTATPAVDSSLSASVTLTFNNVAAKASTRDIHYYAIGNSYLEYTPSTTGFVGWWMAHSYQDDDGNWVANYENRGMAASSADKDYYHRIGAGLQEKFNGAFTTAKFNCATAERSWNLSGTNTDKSNFDYTNAEAAVKEAYAGMVDYLKTYEPNVITVQVQENTGLNEMGSAIAEWYYTILYDLIDENRPEKSIVVIIPPIDGRTGVVAAAERTVAANYSGFFVAEDISDLAPYDSTLQGTVTTNAIGIPDYKYTNPVLAYQQYAEYDAEIAAGTYSTDFRGHPSDYGFEKMAEIVLPIMYEQIPQVIDAETIIIPTDLGAIQHDRWINDNGNPVIDSENATAKLYLLPSNILPNGAPKAVKWSIDNEEIATIAITSEVSESSAALGIEELCVVTPKHNGSVTVTATSAYDETVQTSIVIEIEGQDPHYTLEYSSGTSDTVTNMPSSYEYAAGDYVFPTANPVRAGFKFVGWSEVLGGEAVASVYMDGNKTVYAVWEFAYDWQFNTDGDFEGAEVGGMHAKVEDGYASGNAFGTAAGMSASNLLIPSDSYTTFKARIGFSDVESGDKLVLDITNSAGTKYSFSTSLASTTLTEYTFDITEVEGTIVSFNLHTSNSTLTSNVVTCDYMTFVRAVISADKTYDTYTVDGVDLIESGNYKVTFTSLTVNAGATLELGAGNYVINSLTNNGTIIASPNANVIVNASTKPDGYVEIEIGTKQNTARYAEVNGVEYKIAEASGNTKYGMIVTGDVDRLLQIEDGSKTKYYFIDASAKTATEVTGLADVLLGTDTAQEFGEDSDSRYGAKFEAQIGISKKEETAAYNITEYGYIVSIDELLGSEQLNFELDESMYGYGAAYVKGVSDKVVDSDDTTHTFRAVIYGAPATGYGKKLIVKTYTKVVIQDQEFVIYGPAQFESFYSLAKKLENNDIANAIIDAVDDSSNEPSLDYGDLW